jgi:hypothetical protein
MMADRDAHLQCLLDSLCSKPDTTRELGTGSGSTPLNPSYRSGVSIKGHASRNRLLRSALRISRLLVIGWPKRTGALLATQTV